MLTARYGLNTYNSLFCPHSVFTCVVWIWEQRAIISLYSINWLVCITDTECVYGAVRTECIWFSILPTQCIVWIWEQTAIISLYSINWLVCITDTECVYCAVRAVSLDIMKSIFEMMGRTIPPALSRRPINGEVPVRSQVSPREICSGQVSTSVFSCQYHSIYVPYSSLSTCYC